MKENKGRFPWKDGAKYEAIDASGRVFQYEHKPNAFGNLWWRVGDGKYWYAGESGKPTDYTTTLIERYPSEQAEPAPFVFGPEHVGRRVRHTDGSLTGIVENIDLDAVESVQLVVKWSNDVQLGYYINGAWSTGRPTVVLLDESTPDQTPDLLARVEALEAQLQNLTIRVYDLELVEKSMCESQAVTQSGDVSFDDLRFFVGETNADPDPTAAKVEALKLLFEWREGCNYMTVDPDGDVWQWSVAPIRQGLCWTSLGAAEVAEKIGEIPPDAELSKIIITRTNG